MSVGSYKVFLFFYSIVPVSIRLKLFFLFVYSRLIIIAGDVEPIDIVCHFAGICEERNIPYIYTPSKTDLGRSFCGKGQAMICMIKDHEDFSDLYQKVLSGVEKISRNV